MTRSTTTTTEKIRAVLLATLMVVSVFGGTVAFAGSAVATANSSSFVENVYAGGEDAQISITDTSAAGNDKKIEELEVDLKSGAGDEKSVVLKESGKDTATFEEIVETKVVSSPGDIDTENEIIEGPAGDSIFVEGYDGFAVLDEEAGAPSITDADVVDVRDGNTVVRVDFSESIDPESVEWDGFEFTGSASINRFSVTEEYVELTFDREIQTGTSPELVVEEGSYTDLAGIENTGTSEYVDSVELNLDEGMNFVSAPFEAGGVGFSAMKEKGLLDNVKVVWAYDQTSPGENYWVSYDPDADENELEYLYGGQGYVFVVEDGESAEIDLRSYTRTADDTGNEEDVPGSPQIERIESGWNLIGHYQESSQSVEQALTPLGDTTYDIQTSSGMQLDTLDSGEGYWLYADDNSYHVPVDYDGMSSEQSDVSPESGTDAVTSDVVNGEKMDVDVRVEDDTHVQQVVVDAPELGISGEPLTLKEGSKTNGRWTGSLDVDYPKWYDGSKEVSITVTAMDTDGNLGELTETVDPAKRSATVEITDANVDDGQVAVQVTESKNVENANLRVHVGDARKHGSASSKYVDGDSELTVDLTGSQLSQIDDGDTITATLYERDDSSDEREFSVADTTKTIEKPDGLVYDDDGNMYDTIQTAEDGATETVYVDGGTHETSDRIIVDTSGLTIKAVGGDTSVVSLTHDAETSGGTPVFDVRTHGVTIDGLTIELDADATRDGESSSVAQGVKVGSPAYEGDSTVDVEIKNNVISYTGDDNTNTMGVALLGSSEDLMGATVKDNTLEGFHVGIGISDYYGGSFSDVEMTPNEFSGNEWDTDDDNGAPEISDVTLDKTESGNVDLSFTSSEALATIEVNGDGPNTDGVYKFTKSDFAMSENGDGSYTYTLETSKEYGDGKGQYEVSVDIAEDVGGHNGGIEGEGSGHTDTYDTSSGQ